MEKVLNKAYPVLDVLVLASNLPPNQYKIDIWDEDVIYNYMDTETGIVSYSELVRFACGCCHEYKQKDIDVKELDMLIQCEILIDLYERYCI